MDIKILGADGFVGGHLKKTLANLEHDVFAISKNPKSNVQNETIWLKNISTRTRVIVNLAGKWRGVTNEVISAANFDYPKHVLIKELSFGGRILWIQASSYFQLYKNLYGLDKDLYSLQKSNFSRLLQDLSKNSDKLKVIDIFVPYLSGPNEPIERIFSKLALAKINNSEIHLTSGNAVLPLLDVRDFAKALLDIVETSEENSIGNYLRIYPEVSNVLSLKNHINKSMQEIIDLCIFDALPDRLNEFTNKSVLEDFYKVDVNLRQLATSFKDQVNFLRGNIGV